MPWGEVRVESELGKGSVFSAVSPLLPASAEELQSQIGELSEGLVFDGQHVLLVEDNKVNQQIALNLLLDSGLNITLAENGQEALDLIVSQPFEAVLMDLQMPIMDGLEATRNIRKLDPPLFEVPIVAMTAHAGTEHIEECMQVGMNAHTTKPIDIDLVLSTLVRWIKPSDKKVEKNKSENSGCNFHNISGLNASDVLRRVKDNRTLLGQLLKTFVDTQKDIVQTVSQHIDQ